MAADKKVMLALAGAGAIGVAIYATRSTTRPATVQSPSTTLPDNKARDKKDMGLSGAGIGGTAVAGGNERAIDPSQERKVQTTASSRDKLPSGGVGGGVGAGGMNARTVELPMPKSSSSSIGEKPSSEFLLCQIRQLIQQLNRLRRARDPRRRTHTTRLEVVAPRAEELIADVQRVFALDRRAGRR
ncbi:hypothetical protein BBAD15_g8054 [Beauveria bassiana D1-5]|uniref:Uncharacterized protein n=1 Tax=Beauveria bassiana D1-5 TaxID=1245745 RepID=A0A0A2VJY5_BEABA|nr:hypothetical protein BBAD15_g8054 [Beauveria bassiana D1-5]